jgi:serpin B
MLDCGKGSELNREITMDRRVLMCLAMIACLQSCATAHVPDEHAKENVGAMNNAFAVDLYSRLAADAGNIFFSPTSVQAALAMAAAGAKGETAAEMTKTLHLDATPDAGDKLGAFLRDLNVAGSKGGYELSVANALWGLTGYPFSPAYLSSVEKTYGGHLADVSFTTDPEGSRKTINDWVADKTHDKITNLLPQGSIVPTTRLVLTNAIYFKGKWDKPFQKAQTHDAEFSIDAGKKVNAPFMYQQGKFRYAEDSDAQVLELPYGRDELSMRIILPKAADQLSEIEHKLTTSGLGDLTAQLQTEDVKVWLPRFKIETGYRLDHVLPSMGMKLAFDSGSADFGGMTSASHLFISAVVHKAYVQTDEEGTEAAGATGLTMGATAVMARHEPKVFRADHPFVFQIVHQQTGAILFMGRLATP